MELNEQAIRKAYFSGKLNKFLDELSSDGSLETDDIIKLNNILEVLAVEKRENEKRSAKFYGEVEPPSASELFNTSPEEERKIKVWIDNAREEVNQVNNITKAINTAIKSGKFIQKDDWLGWGFELLSSINLLDNFIIITEQLYRKKITNFIDEFGMSRAEAEERARLTQEYKDYKRASMTKENALEIEMLCKKWAGI